MAVTNGWGKGAQNNTNGWGKSGTNNIGYGAIYESSAAGDTSIIGTSAAFLYSKSSFNQGEADPTPTITGTAGGSFNASANVVFVDTGTYNSSTGQIDLSATSIGSHIITYTVDGVQSGQTVGVTAVPYASTSSFTFDGVNDYFDLGSSINLGINSTLSFWHKTSFNNNGLVVFGESTYAYDYLLQWGSTVNKVYFRIGSTALDFTGITEIEDGNWHHYLVVRTGANAELFVDGVTRSTVSGFSTVTNTLIDTIGATPNNTHNLNSQLDEVSFWNTALSQSAITEIYNSGAPNDLTTLTNASNTNLKAWYKF